MVNKKFKQALEWNHWKSFKAIVNCVWKDDGHSRSRRILLFFKEKIMQEEQQNRSGVWQFMKEISEELFKKLFKIEMHKI